MDLSKFYRSGLKLLDKESNQIINSLLIKNYNT